MEGQHLGYAWTEQFLIVFLDLTVPGRQHCYCPTAPSLVLGGCLEGTTCDMHTPVFPSDSQVSLLASV